MARFSEILTIVNGKNQSKVENPNGSYPIYGSGGVMGYADDYLCGAETVVIGRKGSINKPIYVEEPFWNVDTAFGLVANRDMLLPKYLFYFCVYFDFEQLNTTVTIPSLTKANLLNIEMNLPSLTAQQEIVERLSKVDELISLRKQQLAKLDQLVKSRFIELFGSVEDNVYGLKTVKIKDACDLINGKAFKPEDWSDTGLPIVRIQNLNNDQAPFNFFNGEIKEQYLIDTGELLFSWSGTPGTSFGAFFWNRGKAVLNQHIFRVKPKIVFNLSFLQFALNGRIDYIISKAHGGVGLQHITKKELDEVELLLPAIDHQSEFAAFVEQTDKSKLAVQKSLDKLETLKKALMQKYFG